MACVDPSQAFNRYGHYVILALIQLGGLGITTYSTLVFYLWSRRISLTDRLALSGILLNDPSFHLGRFIQRIVLVMLSLEALGALVLHLLDPERMDPFNAVFLAVSSFCNAGFALWPDSLAQWRSGWGVCLTVMALIILGGLGFAVLDECLLICKDRLPIFFRRAGGSQGETLVAPGGERPQFSYRAKLVFQTTLLLVLIGAVLLFIPEYFTADAQVSDPGELALTSLFQSVSARTAGFNSVDIARMTDVSLLTLIALMFIGGSPGSCASGIKTTSFRILVGFITAQFRGRSQVRVMGRGIPWATLNRVFVLFTFAVLTIGLGTFILACTEGGGNPHGRTPLPLADVFFEVVSAFATAGLSTGVTHQLSPAGKATECLLMFIGRIGPVWLISAMQHLQTEPHYRLPETDLPIG
jgi:trk system potassium uptake protein TrkH